MKKIAAFYFLLSICVLQAQVLPAEKPAERAQAEQDKGPRIVFAENSFDFGDLTQGDKVQHVFTFTNEGNEALLLVNVRTTCGCTAPSWPKTPLLPGESGELTIAYNSTNKIGVQNKIITVQSNAVNNPAAKLSIRAVVSKR